MSNYQPKYVLKQQHSNGPAPTLPANNSHLSSDIDLYNQGSVNPSGNLPIVSPSQFDQVVNSSHSHYQSPSGSTLTNNTPQSKMNGNGLNATSPINMTSPSGMSMGMGSIGMMNGMNGTPTYSTDSIVGDYNTLMDGSPCAQLKKYLEPYTQEELRKLLFDLAKEDSNVCKALLDEIKRDKKWCKLFVHGLSFSTSKETLEKEYSQYGQVKEAVVLVDKKGQSKGYGFVTFGNAEEALKAAKDPKKRIDQRMTHCNLAFKGNPKKFQVMTGAASGLSPKQRENANDRRLFVHSLAWKTTDDSLQKAFQQFGQLVEAVVIRDKKTNKSKGYGFVTYKYSESAQAALRDPNKKIDGRLTHCNFACERNGDGTVVTSPMTMNGDSMTSPNGNMNGMSMGNGHSNTPSLMQQSSNPPMLSTYSSNPMSLGPLPNSNGQRSNNGPSINTPNQFGGNSATPNRNGMNPMNGMNGMNSFTSPSYGQSNQNSYSNHGMNSTSMNAPYPAPPSMNSTMNTPNQFGMNPAMNSTMNSMAPLGSAMNSSIPPNGMYAPSDPTKTIFGPRSNSPLNLSGIRGVGNVSGITPTTLLPNNNAPGGGSNHYGGPPNMMMGGQSQHNPSNNSNIVVGGAMNNNLFSSVPPAVPNSPGLGQPSPQHQGMPSKIPMFNQGASDISVLSSLQSMPMPMPQITNFNSMSSMGPPPSRKIVVQDLANGVNNPPMMMPSAPTQPMNGVLATNRTGNGVGGMKAQVPSVKIPASTNSPQDEGATGSPKSQADDEGDAM